MNDQLPPKYIAIEGNIGVGKSTLTRKLVAELGYSAQEEPVDGNPVLPLHYQDMRRWACTTQLWMLHLRHRLHQRALWTPCGIVADRSFWGDTCFARACHQLGHMNDVELELYWMAFDNMRRSTVEPDLMIFLHATPAMCLQRIRKRDRPMERGITVEYLETLQTFYNILEQEMTGRTVILPVDWTNPDEDYPALLANVKEAILTTGWQYAKRRPRGLWE